jgi:hypothetical protein
MAEVRTVFIHHLQGNFASTIYSLHTVSPPGSQITTTPMLQGTYMTIKKALTIATGFLLFGLPVFGQAKEYKLQSRTSNADLDQKAIFLIDTAASRESIRNAFDPVKGKYTVYLFIALHRGLSYNNTEKDFHDILVLKTDKRDKILAAYQYTLEWAEMPATSDLYQATAHGITLKNGLPIQKLRFKKAVNRRDRRTELKETGFLEFGGDF